jgi:hypothetical protein
MEDPLRQVFKVTRRTVDEHGQPLLLPQVEVESYWASLGDAPAQIAELYEHRGTAEQFHSEIKTDLGSFPQESLSGAPWYCSLACLCTTS